MADAADSDVVYHEPRPRILLINFSVELAQALAAKGHNVKRCTVTAASVYASEVPPHETDIVLIRNSQPDSPVHDQIRWSTVASPVSEFCLKAKYAVCVFFSGSPGHIGIGPYNMQYRDADLLIPGKTAHRLRRAAPYECVSDFVERHLRKPPHYVALLCHRQPVGLVPLLEDQPGAIFAAVEPRPMNIGGHRPFLWLPDYGNDPDVIHDLLENVLSQIAPDLFDHTANLSWTKDSAFIHPEVELLQHSQEQVKEEAERRIADLARDIQAVETQDEFVLELLTKKDGQLKSAVKKALESLFRYAGVDGIAVIDVDEDREHRGGSSEKREDLRIEWDGTFYLLNTAGRDQAFTFNSLNQLSRHERLFLRERKVHIDAVHSLLIGNHRAGPTDPRKRGDLFGNATTQARDQLVGNEHGAVSTADVVRLLRAVQRQQIPFGAADLKRFLNTEGVFDWPTFVTQVSERAPEGP